MQECRRWEAHRMQSDILNTELVIPQLDPLLLHYLLEFLVDFEARRDVELI